MGNCCQYVIFCSLERNRLEPDFQSAEVPPTTLTRFFHPETALTMELLPSLSMLMKHATQMLCKFTAFQLFQKRPLISHQSDFCLATS